MSLLHLRITHFRNLLSVELNPTPLGFNVLFGKNGSGKTSLLEAIYYLGLGRSFRSTLTGRIVNHHADHFSLFAEVAASTEQIIPLGIERHLNSDLKIRIAGKNVDSLAELVEMVPVQFINADCCQLLTGGPQFRRKFLDWGVFYYKKDFLPTWRNFQRILKQRNVLLRNLAAKDELSIWTTKLIEQAVVLHQLRQEYSAELFQTLTSILPQLLDTYPFDINYYPGWDTSSDYQSILSESLHRDLQLGYTEFGPHKADIKITIKGVPAKDILSRGQQKLFVCGMILTQGSLLHKHINRRPIYLVDDMSSELDLLSKNKLIAQLSAQEAQIFVTSIDEDVLTNNLLKFPVKLFHVEQGSVTEADILVT